MAEPLRFQTVEVPDEQPKPPGLGAATNILLLALKVLAQRTLVAIADLFMLLTVGSAWWLWWSVPRPDVLQIVALGIYALFVLLANWIVRKSR
jgi:hypothetical protein